MVGQLWTWTVAVAAVLAALLTGGRGAVRELLSRLVRWRVGLRWYAVVLLGPAAFWVLTTGLFAALGGIWEDGPLASTATDWALLSVVLLIAALTDGLGEELGWRGFALPQLLARYTPLAASLVLGVVWAAWHLPLLWTSGAALHQQPPWLLVLDVTAKAILFTWVFLHTRGSVLLAVLFHASLNVFSIPLAASSAGRPALQVLALVLEWVIAAAVVVATRREFLGRARDPACLPHGHRVGSLWVGATGSYARWP
ncbi:CPBP family intramembrane glutamic endopeptidase [Actinomycetospora sp. CA-101289]|uniref:CPBP family intramembrane glutamic endopeptidase n=1 Tax=Actinomycetospora sp. CA-101289 TaxID=3239893 RepID=UPI003D96CCCE